MKGLLLSAALAATLALPMAAHAQREDSTAPMPLDLALAKRLPLPEPLTSLQKLLGTPGEVSTPEGPTKEPGEVWYRWYHDCGDA